jgi:nuclear pore complex protein Nup160
MERLHCLQGAGSDGNPGTAIKLQDEMETSITNQYLSMINALSCVDEKQAWIFDEGPFVDRKKRKLLTLKDLRRQYDTELDRLAAIENGQFAFADPDVMDVL